MPVDAVDSREDFQLWYADGDLFLTVKSDWKCERDRVAIYSRHGGEMGRIRSDPNGVRLNVGVERYENELFTYTIFEHYFVKGMLWDITGRLDDPPIDFSNQGTGKSDVRISRVKFRDKGLCYEIKVKDLSKLRVAACAVIAIKIKESFKGRSEGEPDEDAGTLSKLKKRLFDSKGITYEELMAKKALEKQNATDE